MSSLVVEFLTKIWACVRATLCNPRQNVVDGVATTRQEGIRIAFEGETRRVSEYACVMI